MSKRKEHILAVQSAIDDLKNKKFNVSLLSIDSKGRAIASVANIYEHAKVLNDLGYSVTVITEKNDYTSVESWMGAEYSSLPHVSAESQKLQIKMNDFLIIPEVYGNVLEQTANLPCKKVVFAQAYDLMLDYMPPGTSWTKFGVFDCITTSETQKNYIQSVIKNVNCHIIPVGIPDYFKPSDKPKKPVVAINCRQTRDTMKIIKTFYLKYPQFKWISFKSITDMSRSDFANVLSSCCLSVWVDEISGFGTFPLESMKCGTPVIGLVPNLAPEWMEKENGYWTDNVLNIPDMVASYMKDWLEDVSHDEVLNNMKSLDQKYTEAEQKQKIEEVYTTLFNNRIKELEGLLLKIEGVEEVTNG